MDICSIKEEVEKVYELISHKVVLPEEDRLPQIYKDTELGGKDLVWAIFTHEFRTSIVYKDAIGLDFVRCKSTININGIIAVGLFRAVRDIVNKVTGESIVSIGQMKRFAFND